MDLDLSDLEPAAAYGDWWQARYKWSIVRSELPSWTREHGHPLQSRVARPLFTRLSHTGRAGSPCNRWGALRRHLTGGESVLLSEETLRGSTCARSARHHRDANRDVQRGMQDNRDSLVIADRFSFALRRLVIGVSLCNPQTFFYSNWVE